MPLSFCLFISLALQALVSYLTFFCHYTILLKLREKAMDTKDRIELIRKGNELFNNGDIETAAKIFAKTGYKDGLTRVADHYFFDRRLPLNALPYYKMANCEAKVKEIYDRMLFALGKMLKGGTDSKITVKLPPLKVSPKLKILAEEILSREEK